MLARLLAAGILTTLAFEPASAQVTYGGGNVAAPSAAGAGAAARGGWHIVPELDTELDFTDNANLTSTDRRSDFVTQITPRLAVYERSAHTTLTGNIAAPIYLYARTGSENDAVRPDVSLVGNAELVPRLFYVDGSVQVSQQYFSPFGGRPQSQINATDNRYTAQSYRISPYFKGNGANDLHYELRDNNTWSNASGAPVATNNAYTNEISGNVTRDPRPGGWALDYNRTETKFTDQATLRSQLERGRALWQPDPSLELSLSAGYEDNHYPLLDTSGAIYGGGFKWRPTDRTKLDATWEHRFFGSSYHATFSNRTRLTTWSLTASRDITSYPQQLANLAAGVDVDTLLNGLFASRVSDPVQREAFVQQLIQDRGLPPVLSSPLALFTEQITLQQTLQATMGLLGARNSVFVTAYRTRNEPVAGQAGTPTGTLIDVLALQTNNIQTGANVVWSYKLTQLYTLSSSVDWVRTVPIDDSSVESNQRTFSIVLSAPLSPLTNVYTGVRHQRLVSDVQQSYRETAVFVGMRHVFK